MVTANAALDITDNHLYWQHPVNGKIEMTGTRATATITQTEPTNAVPPPTVSNVSLGLENGKVYEFREKKFLEFRPPA